MLKLQARSISRQSIEKFLRGLRLSQRLNRAAQHRPDETRSRSILDLGRSDSFDLGSDGARYIRTIQADGHQPQERIEIFCRMIRPGKLGQIPVEDGFA